MRFSCTMLRDYLILSIWCCDSHWCISYLTLICIHRYLPCLLFDIWYRYLSCYTYYLIIDTGTCHVRLITWYRHRYMSCYTYCLISDTGTCHAIHITWYLTPVLAMLYLLFDIWHRYLSCYTYYLICFHVVQVHWPDIVTLNTLPPLIPVLYGIFMTITFTGTWLLYCYQIFGTPELLYSWTPEKGWLLILYSWYYTPVNSHRWIIMDILYTLVDIIFGQYI